MRFKVSEILWGKGENLDNKDKAVLAQTKMNLSHWLTIVAGIVIIGTSVGYVFWEGFSWNKVLFLLPFWIVFIILGGGIWLFRTPQIKINGIIYKHHWGFRTKEEMDAEVERLKREGIEPYTTSLEKDIPRYQVWVRK